MRRKILKTDNRDIIIQSGVELARREGWVAVTRNRVAKEAGVANGTVSYVFETMDIMRGLVMTAIIARLEGGEDCNALLRVVASELVRGSLEARRASPALKQQMLKLI